MSGQTREVRIGDRNVVVPRFNGYKATVAGEIIAKVTEESPKIANAAAAFRLDYEQKNVERITRAEAKLPRNMRKRPVIDPETGEYREAEDGRIALELVPVFSDGDFDESGVIEIPSSPTTQEQVAAVFPMIWKLARDEIVTLLALVTAPNRELADADEDGTIDEYLKTKGREILHEGDLDQIVEALVVAIEVLRDQFKGKPGAVGKIAAFFDNLLTSENAETATSDEAPPTSKPSSSIDSPERTDGREGSLSTSASGAS